VGVSLLQSGLFPFCGYNRLSSGPLKLSTDDLFEFIRVIEKHKQDLEQDITRELQEYMSIVIEKGKDREIFKDAKVKLLLSKDDNQKEETKTQGKAISSKTRKKD